MRSQIRTFRLTSLAVAGLALSAAACKDTTDIHHPGEDVVAMRLTITGQPPVTVSNTGVASGSLTLTNGVGAIVTVEFLNDNNADALGEHAEDYEVFVSPAAGVTFARTGPFTGILTGSTNGAIFVQFGLFHLDEAHLDFGPWNVTVNVAP